MSKKAKRISPPSPGLSAGLGLAGLGLAGLGSLALSAKDRKSFIDMADWSKNRSTADTITPAVASVPDGTSVDLANYLTKGHGAVSATYAGVPATSAIMAIRKVFDKVPDPAGSLRHYRAFSESPARGLEQLLTEAAEPYGYGGERTWFDWNKDTLPMYNADGTRNDGGVAFKTKLADDFKQHVHSKMEPDDSADTQVAKLNNGLSEMYRLADQEDPAYGSALRKLVKMHGDKSVGTPYGTVTNAGVNLADYALYAGAGLAGVGALGLLWYYLKRRKQRAAGIK